MNRGELETQQEQLRSRLQIPAGLEGFFPAPGSLVFTADVQYEGERAFVSIDICEWPGNVITLIVESFPIPAAYEPGYFAFREGPLVAAIINNIQSDHQLQPDLLITDGHGTAHPRRMGLACWLGITLNIPTIGIAKESLLPAGPQPDLVAGSRSPVLHEGELVGYALRTQTGINPIYVSAGHSISQENSVSVIYALRGKYRIPEPLRRADQAARKYARGQT